MDLEEKLTDTMREQWSSLPDDKGLFDVCECLTDGEIWGLARRYSQTLERQHQLKASVEAYKFIQQELDKRREL